MKEQRSETATEKEGGKWSSYQYVGRTGSTIPTASLAGTEVSVEEIRTAGSFSDHYPPSIHAALVSSPEPDPNGTPNVAQLANSDMGFEFLLMGLYYFEVW